MESGEALDIRDHAYLRTHNLKVILVTWQVEISEHVQLLLGNLDGDETIKVVAAIRALEQRGPTLGRPFVDTLKGSRHKNMKELRIQHVGKHFRILFAFDPKRSAILLLGGDKIEYGVDRFYEDLIPQADELFDQHLASLNDKAAKGATPKAKKARRKVNADR